MPVTLALEPWLSKLAREKQSEFVFRKEISFTLDIVKANSPYFSVVIPLDLARAISNCINNSVDSLTQDEQVEIRLFSDLGFNVVSISDNGKGIPPDVLKRLGIRGFSYGKNNSESGNGLGIYHAKRVLKKVGGRLEVTSQWGHGTKVAMFLPATGYGDTA